VTFQLRYIVPGPVLTVPAFYARGQGRRKRGLTASRRAYMTPQAKEIHNENAITTGSVIRRSYHVRSARQPSSILTYGRQDSQSGRVRETLTRSNKEALSSSALHLYLSSLCVFLSFAALLDSTTEPDERESEKQTCSDSGQMQVGIEVRSRNDRPTHLESP
jgi:hypothetical protein